MPFYVPFFLLFLIFVLWAAFERSKATRIEKTQKEQFWQRENEANNVRRQSLDNLAYVIIPDEILLPNLLASPVDDEELIRYNDILSDLKDKRILNLTGKTTTDIKFMFGPANLATVDEYDMNFTLFAKTIYAYGQQLSNLGYEQEAITVLRFGIDSLSDISGNYKLLAQLYKKHNQSEKISELKEIAGGLDSLLKNAILRSLDELS